MIERDLCQYRCRYSRFTLVSAAFVTPGLVEQEGCLPHEISKSLLRERERARTRERERERERCLPHEISKSLLRVCMCVCM